MTRSTAPAVDRARALLPSRPLVGLVGAGSMAAALARGWGQPIMCTDRGSGRAQALACDVGGEALADNGTLAERADIVVLCHEPGALYDVAADLQAAQAVVSVLSGVCLDDLEAAYPATPVLRFAVNLAVEARHGVVLYGGARRTPTALEQAALDLFGRLGQPVSLPEAQLPVAVQISGVGPAYLACLVEAQTDAAIRHGLSPDVAGKLAAQTLAGTAALLEAGTYSTLGLRRAVASPGGVTAAGLAALESGGLRRLINEVMDETARAMRRVREPKSVDRKEVQVP